MSPTTGAPGYNGATAGLGPAEAGVAELERRLRTSPFAALDQPFTLSQARQALSTTRRVAVPLLEHLDGRGWTRRVDGQLREVAR